MVIDSGWTPLGAKPWSSDTVVSAVILKFPIIFSGCNQWDFHVSFLSGKNPRVIWSNISSMQMNRFLIMVTHWAGVLANSTSNRPAFAKFHRFAGHSYEHLLGISNQILVSLSLYLPHCMTDLPLQQFVVKWVSTSENLYDPEKIVSPL